MFYNIKIVFYIFIIIILIIIICNINNKKEYFTNINDLYESNISEQKSLNKNINDYTDVFNENPFVFFLLNNKDIQINKTTPYIIYNNTNIRARRNDSIHYSINNKKLNKFYEIWRYPDFINEKKRHSKNYMNKYINFFYENYVNKNKNNIFEFTSFHGILDNKVRLWTQLIKNYGRKISSTIMPITYLIPDDEKIFYKDYYYKNNGNKFILKNSYMGGKSGIKISNSYQEIIGIFNKNKNNSIYFVRRYFMSWK